MVLRGATGTPTDHPEQRQITEQITPDLILLSVDEGATQIDLLTHLLLRRQTIPQFSLQKPPPPGHQFLEARGPPRSSNPGRLAENARAPGRSPGKSHSPPRCCESTAGPTGGFSGKGPRSFMRKRRSSGRCVMAKSCSQLEQ